MLIEIHMIQNHSPANLNRDDLGAPKTCIFGGVTRARVSSQCLKRSIRRSPEFAAALENDGGVQTRSLIREVAKEASNNGVPDEDTVKTLEGIFKDGGVPIESKKGDETATKIIWVLPRSAIKLMAAATKQKDRGILAEKIAGILRDSAIVPDIALAGRMTEFDAKGKFENLTRKLRVEAALQAAHAISTHSVINEVDYFTAAEDLAYTQGAAHPDEAMFVSACFYKYFSLDWDQLLFNLAGPEPDKDTQKEIHKKWTDEVRPNAEKLASATLGHFLRAAALTTPSGKQNSHASHCESSAILVEIKGKKTPTNYANAFAEPARRIGDAPDDSADCVSLIGRSIAQLGDHVYAVRQAYGVDSTLLWYTAQPWRYPLQGWEREPDGRKMREGDNEKPPVQYASRVFNMLGGAKDKPVGLVEAVVKEVSGLEWAEVCDAGKGS
jgi:CRISPR system Cascade subunit CasC